MQPKIFKMFNQGISQDPRNKSEGDFALISHIDNQQAIAKWQGVFGVMANVYMQPVALIQNVSGSGYTSMRYIAVQGGVNTPGPLCLGNVIFYSSDWIGGNITLKVAQDNVSYSRIQVAPFFISYLGSAIALTANSGTVRVHKLPFDVTASTTLGDITSTGYSSAVDFSQAHINKSDTVLYIPIGNKLYSYDGVSLSSNYVYKVANGGKIQSITSDDNYLILLNNQVDGQAPVLAFWDTRSPRETQFHYIEGTPIWVENINGTITVLTKESDGIALRYFNGSKVVTYKRFKGATGIIRPIKHIYNDAVYWWMDFKGKKGFWKVSNEVGYGLRLSLAFEIGESNDWCESLAFVQDKPVIIERTGSLTQDVRTLIKSDGFGGSISSSIIKPGTIDTAYITDDRKIIQIKNIKFDFEKPNSTLAEIKLYIRGDGETTFRLLNTLGSLNTKVHAVVQNEDNKINYPSYREFELRVETKYLNLLEWRIEYTSKDTI